MEYIINHQPELHLFTTELDGYTAYVEYRLDNGNLDILHTIVPPPIEGKGIAAALVKKAYEYAAEQGLKPKATCWYAAKWLERHPEIEVFCGRDFFSADEREISEIVRCLKNFSPWEFPAGTLSVAFLGDEDICKMHADFLNDPSKTDVITFPGDEIFSSPRERRSVAGIPENRDAFAGEICVCVDQALRMAAELKTAPEDELLLYLVHGWLHLAGFDDIDERDRAAMRAAEKLSLDLLREKNLAPLKTATFPR